MEKTMKKKMILLISAVLVLAICSGIIVAFANGTTTTTTTPTTSTSSVLEESSNENNEEMMPWSCGWLRGRPGGWLRGWKRHGFIEVSEEFEAKVIEIAESDLDVQNLLEDEYEVIGVRPIIKTIVDADGNVVIKATSAIVMLSKDTTDDTTGRASVWVDVEAEKVTRIEILTRTVIEKP